MPAPPVVVEVVRGDVVESVHEVDAAVVDLEGSLLHEAGEPERVAYFRSSLKPIQAAVSMAQGWEPPGDEEIAVACSSHNAEPSHIAVVQSILSSVGLSEDALRCPPAFPLYPPAAAKVGEPKRILRDCSGKHAAFLAASVARGWPLETYLDPAHPIQRAVIERTIELCGAGGPIGVDGCGAPTLAFPLWRIALGFVRGVESEKRIAHAMRTHPFLVAGTERICTDVMAAGQSDLIMKAGAEAILCFASASRGIGAALKVRDGTSRATRPAAMRLLQKLGFLEELSPALRAHATPPVLGGGKPAGFLRIAG